MIVRNAGIESKLPTPGDFPRRFSSGEPTLVTQGMAAPRDVVVRGAPVRVPLYAVEASSSKGAAGMGRPALSALAAGASHLR